MVESRIFKKETLSFIIGLIICSNRYMLTLITSRPWLPKGSGKFLYMEMTCFGSFSPRPAMERTADQPR
jgi:hypothetical protein